MSCSEAAYPSVILRVDVRRITVWKKRGGIRSQSVLIEEGGLTERRVSRSRGSESADMVQVDVSRARVRVQVVTSGVGVWIRVV